MNAFREWLNAQLGTDGGRAVQMVLALLVVVLLLLIIAWVFRRLSGAGFSAHRGGRLSVVDAAAVDGQRRLVLLRRDDVEHLVMIGGPNDLLVESRILHAPPVVAGRAATVFQKPGVPVSQTPNPSVAEPRPSRPPVAADKAHERALPIGASIAAAVATMGAFVRSRSDNVRRPSATEDRSAEPPAEAYAPETSTQPVHPDMAALEDALFDRPLGRPAFEPAPSAQTVVAPRAEPVKRAPVAAPPTFSAPPAPPAFSPAPPAFSPAPAAGTPASFAVSSAPEPVPPASPLEGPTTLDRAEIAEEIQRGLDHMTQPEPAPLPPPVRAKAPRTIDEIDFVSELDDVVASFARDQIRGQKAPAPFTGSVSAITTPAAPPPSRLPEPPVSAAPQAAAEPEPVEIRSEATADSNRIEPHFEGAAFADPVFREPTHRESPRVGIEPITEPEPVAVEPVPAPLPTPKPSAPVAPAAEVDELEEEMARLLSELSGPPRR